MSYDHLVGGFNPFEKYQSKWESSPNRDENKKYLSCHHPVIFKPLNISLAPFPSLPETPIKIFQSLPSPPLCQNVIPWSWSSLPAHTSSKATSKSDAKAMQTSNFPKVGVIPETSHKQRVREKWDSSPAYRGYLVFQPFSTKKPMIFLGEMLNHKRNLRSFLNMILIRWSVGPKYQESKAPVETFTVRDI